MIHPIFHLFKPITTKVSFELFFLMIRRTVIVELDGDNAMWIDKKGQIEENSKDDLFVQRSTAQGAIRCEAQSLFSNLGVRRFSFLFWQVSRLFTCGKSYLLTSSDRNVLLAEQKE